jgi:hypothetical protein
VFINSRIFVDYNHGGLDVITENNFFDSGTLVDLADAPFVDRNYWSDYVSKYPSASEVAELGIWDTPYVGEVAWATNRSIDYHPLVNPNTDIEFPNFNGPQSSTPTFIHFPTINAGAEPPKANPYSTTIFAAVTFLVVLAITAGALVYRKKHKLNLVRKSEEFRSRQV